MQLLQTCDCKSDPAAETALSLRSTARSPLHQHTWERWARIGIPFLPPSATSIDVQTHSLRAHLR